jgi:hypothetical protein
MNRGRGQIALAVSCIHTYRIFGGNSFTANQIGHRSTEDDWNKLTPPVFRVKVTLEGWLTKLWCFLYSLPSKMSLRVPGTVDRLNRCCKEFQKFHMACTCSKQLLAQTFIEYCWFSRKFLSGWYHTKTASIRMHKPMGFCMDKLHAATDRSTWYLHTKLFHKVLTSSSNHLCTSWTVA